MSKKKRPNGDGCITHKPNGRWEAQVMVGYRPDGTPDIRSFSGATQAEALAKMRNFLVDRTTNRWKGENILFRLWALKWLEDHKEDISQATYENYSYILKTIISCFGETKLIDIRTMDVEAFLKSLQKDGRSRSYITKARGLLFQLFNQAEANDMVNKNPVRLAKKMRHQLEQEKDTFTAEEIKLLMEHLPKNTRMGCSIRLLLGTGIRLQELLALEPRFIAEDGSMIQIRQAINMENGKGIVGTTKSRTSLRDVPVPESLRWYALLLRNTDRRFILESERNPGCPLSPSCYRDRFKVLIGSIEGVRVLTPHCCRHTYVSQLHALGVSVETIQSIVGHADVDMTRHYLHVPESVRQNAVQRFSDAFSTL